MRSRALLVSTLAAALALAVSACGGGGNGDGGTTDLADTSATGLVETVGPRPPTTETQGTAEPVQIRIPKASQPVGPQSPVEQISELQQALVLLGYKIGKADGIYGEKTRKAVVKFQKAHHLEADGLVGPKTAKAINKELAKLPTQP